MESSSPNDIVMPDSSSFESEQQYIPHASQMYQAPSFIPAPPRYIDEGSQTDDPTVDTVMEDV